MRPPEMIFCRFLFPGFFALSSVLTSAIFFFYPCKTHELSTKSYLGVPRNPGKSVYMGQLSTSPAEIPAVFAEIPAIFAEIPAVFAEIPAIFAEIPVIFAEIPAVFAEVPAIFAEIPVIFAEIPAVFAEVPAIFAEIPAVFAEISARRVIPACPI